MLQVGRRPDFGQEPAATDDRGQLRSQHLERHFPIVPQIVGEVDGRHAAGA